MAYDEALAARIRDELAGTKGVTEKLMFGGICFLLNGNMLGGVSKADMIVRVGAEAHAESVKQPGARVFDFGPRPMVGMLFVGPVGTKKPADLKKWIARAMTFVKSLPAKAPKGPKAKKAMTK
jgi:TfoX/Sxy family transcriptional regulator of competence genes